MVETSLTFVDEAVRGVLDLDELIAAVEKVLVDYSAGRLVQPERQILPVPDRGGYLASMPAVGEGVGVKLVTIYPGNAGTPVPTYLDDAAMGHAVIVERRVR